MIDPAAMSVIEWAVLALSGTAAGATGYLHVRLSAHESSVKADIEQVRVRAHELSNMVQRDMLLKADFDGWRSDTREDMRAMESRIMGAISELRREGAR